MDSINITIVIFKNGDQVICDLKEVYDGDAENKKGKGICLLMIHPYLLSFTEVTNLENPEQDLQVKFSKWCPYSIDYQFKIPYDSVLAIGSCDPGLAIAYTNKIEQVNQLLNYGNVNNTEKNEKIISSEIVSNE